MIQAGWKVIGYFELCNGSEIRHERKKIIICSIEDAIRHSVHTGRHVQLNFKTTKWIEHALQCVRRRAELRRTVGENSDGWYREREKS